LVRKQKPSIKNLFVYRQHLIRII